MSSTPSPGTCTLSFPTARPTSTSSNFLSCEIEPSADPRHVSIGCLAQPTTFTESDCSVDTERVRSIRIEVYGVSVILSFQNSTTLSTDALECWTTNFFESFHHLCGGRIPYCFRCTTESSKPFLFVCRPRNVQCPRENLDFFGIWNTLFWISFVCLFEIIEHWHEDDSIFKILRFKISILQVVLDLLKKFQWRKSWEKMLLELNRFSIDS